LTLVAGAKLQGVVLEGPQLKVVGRESARTGSCGSRLAILTSSCPRTERSGWLWSSDSAGRSPCWRIDRW